MEPKPNVVQMTPPSPTSALAKKIMSDLLFEHYDLSAEDYKTGWTDARIAKESGLSEAFVAQRRAGDYGPIKPPKPDPLTEISIIAKPLAIELADVLSSLKATADKAEALAERVRKLANIASEAPRKSA